MSNDEQYQQQIESNQELLDDQVMEQDMTTPITKEKIAFAKAMSKFQGEITGAKKDSNNPFFKSSYADLASCWDAIRGPLADNGLSILQMPKGGADGLVTLETIILHEGGHLESCVMSMAPVKRDPQGLGSCLTYLRRYMLSAVTGLAQVDDDANAATGGGKKGKDNKKPTQKQLEYLTSLIKKNWNWKDFSAKFGVEKMSELDAATTSDAIEELNAMVTPQGVK